MDEFLRLLLNRTAWNKVKLFKTCSTEHKCSTIKGDCKSLQIEYDEVKTRVA